MPQARVVASFFQPGCTRADCLLDCEALLNNGATCPRGSCEDQPHTVSDNGSCYCESGYTWCMPNDASDFSCCVEGSTTFPPDDAACTLAHEGFLFCTVIDEDNVELSTLYVCEAGLWQERPEAMDTWCEDEGHGPALGCYDTGTEILFVCAS